MDFVFAQQRLNRKKIKTNFGERQNLILTIYVSGTALGPDDSDNKNRRVPHGLFRVLQFSNFHLTNTHR